MSQKSFISYKNNSSYRNQIQINEEDHKQFLKFPFKQNDSVVESGASLYTSKRDLSGKCDTTTLECAQNKTILEALNEAEKEMENENKLFKKKENSFQLRQMQRTKQTIIQSNKMQQQQQQQQQEQNLSNTLINIEEVESKVVPIRLMKVLKLLVNIQHFFRILSMNARIFNRLTQNQHYLIGDVASIYSKNSNLTSGNNIFYLACNFLYYMIRLAQNLNIQVFNPSNVLIKVWDSVQSVIILFTTFLLNLELFFQMDITNFQPLFQILLIASIIDIFVELNTGVLQKGDIIYNRNFIFQSYMKNTFFLNITFYVSYEKDHKNLFDLLKLLVFVIGICHIFCLFWHGLCIFEINNGYSNNWITSKNLIDATIYERYIYSFYFLAVTMATVGYGDITPQNSVEVLFTTITIFVTCVVYAFSLNTIGGIIENIEKKDKKYKENLQIIHGLMREEEVSRELKIEVSNYIEYLYKESNEIRKKQEKLIIEKLSTKLRNDLVLEIQGKYLNNIPLFKHIKEKDKIAKIMEEQLYSPGEMIFHQGDQDDNSLYYIVKGSVSIIFNPTSNQNREAKQIHLIKKKEYFGEISFINGNPRTFSAKAADFCRIYKINRQQFIQVIQENDQDFENFQMIKEAFQLNKNYKFCSIFCSICKSGNHFSMECPRTHLTLTRQIIISRYNSYSPQERSKFKRRKFKLNYLSKIEGLLTALIEINNCESLFEILDQIENGCNNFDDIQDEMVPYKENQKEEYLRKITLNQNNLSVDNNANSQVEFQKKHLEYEESQDKVCNQLSNQNKNNQSFVKQLSKGNKFADKVTQYQQQQMKKSFLYQASQYQVIPENMNGENSQEKKVSFQNFQEQIPSSTSSSDEEGTIFSSIKKKNSKENIDLISQKKPLEEDQQILTIDKFNNENLSQKKNSVISQKRDSNNFNLIQSKSFNQQISTQMNEVSNQSIISDLKNININLNDRQKINNNKQLNYIIKSRRTLRGTQDNNFLENILNQISNIPTIQVEEQKEKNQTINIDFQRKLSKLSQSANNKRLSLLSQSQLVLNNNQHSFSQLEQINEANLQRIGKRPNDIIESSDQVNYQMLQIFDKAKVFKYYLPHFNYPEIVQKWIIFQTKRLKMTSNFVGIAQKKKRFMGKRKQSKSQNYIQTRQTEV
ncbi:cation channel family protein (macronuclear) [Tetrahymena thermophila SB210]|uniref:Cation channel family protein n=1 Tax=Tetrahymena thermophila (strain SB210) TaxID=312017 RepID=W7WX58_TETTS|nr:cation channel family protein [Tetrahymena thermophila SB210]EWS71395.1 cation channel family protein [Tetrahymena thermophila SB210]|eukprot:XP_012656067.1 cation channel family protein [Tetrahymena thermophila SB210]